MVAGGTLVGFLFGVHEADMRGQMSLLNEALMAQNTGVRSLSGVSAHVIFQGAE